MRTGPENAWASSGTYQGMVAQLPNDTSTTSIDKIYYLATTTNWELADKSAESTSFGPLGWALNTNGTTTGFLLHGIVRQAASLPLSVGTPLYLWTSGQITSSTPTTGYVRLIGYTYFTNTVYFCTDNTFIDL